MQATDEDLDLGLLPDQDEAEYVDDGQAEQDAGPEAEPGVEYPSAEKEED
ncbi:MAG TPA: hypothetical protein VFT31_07110 [Kribbella sp.]|nr:hypothetical protein [Kribbella sp.]